MSPTLALLRNIITRYFKKASSIIELKFKSPFQF
jgi:hypothetical protein